MYLSICAKSMISSVYPTGLHSEKNFFVWWEHDKATILNKQKGLDIQVSYFMFHCEYFAVFFADASLTCVLEAS